MPSSPARAESITTGMPIGERVGLERGEQLEAVHPRHHHVGEHQVRRRARAPAPARRRRRRRSAPRSSPASRPATYSRMSALSSTTRIRGRPCSARGGRAPTGSAGRLGAPVRRSRRGSPRRPPRRSPTRPSRGARRPARRGRCPVAEGHLHGEGAALAEDAVARSPCRRAGRRARRPGRGRCRTPRGCATGRRRPGGTARTGAAARCAGCRCPVSATTSSAPSGASRRAGR